MLGDFDEALEKIDCENANIITHNTSLYNDSELLKYGSDYVVDCCSLADFRSEVGHSQEAPTYGYLEEKTVIEGRGEKLLPYVVDKFFEGKYTFQLTDLLYIKNVLISSAHLKIPFLAEGVELKGLVVNVVSKKIVPNVSRNNISDAQIRDLSYAVGKAIHMWICREGDLETEEKSLIQAFINKCYADKSEYLKN